MTKEETKSLEEKSNKVLVIDLDKLEELSPNLTKNLDYACGVSNTVEDIKKAGRILDLDQSVVQRADFQASNSGIEDWKSGRHEYTSLRIELIKIATDQSIIENAKVEAAKQYWGQKWIDVKERLPDNYDWVLGINGQYPPIVCKKYERITSISYSFINAEYFGITVTHWQPLPAPPTI